MNLFVAYNHTGNITSIIFALNREVAESYWLGKNIFPVTVREYTESDFNEHPYAVMPVLNMKEKKLDGPFGKSILVQDI